MNYDNLPYPVGFLFITIGQAASTAFNNDLDKEEFLEFCKEMWETMELNTPQKFSKILEGVMKKETDAALGEGMSDKLIKKASKK